MRVFLQQAKSCVFSSKRIKKLANKLIYTFRVSGYRGIWIAAQKYVRSRWSSLREKRKNIFVRQTIDEFLSSLAIVKDGVIFISHDAQLNGAPINLLNQCKAYRQVYGDNLVILLVSGGPLIEDFRAVAPVINLNRDLTNIVIDKDVEYLFRQLRRLGYSRCIANTVVSGAFQESLRRNGIETVFEIHELIETIRINGWEPYADSIAKSNSIVVFAANYVARKFMENFDLSGKQVRILPQGVANVYSGNKAEARERLLYRLGLSDFEHTKIVLGVGYATHRKGTDLFCEVAAEFHKKERRDVHFIWLGYRNEYFEDWKNKTLPQMPYKHNLHFWDFDPHPEYIFAGADIFLLTSREDPFPSVALEALVNKTPVIAFKDTGGIQEILDGTNGVVVGHLDVQQMANVAWEILQNPDKMRPPGTQLHTYPEFIQVLMSYFSDQSRQAD